MNKEVSNQGRRMKSAWASIDRNTLCKYSHSHMSIHTHTYKYIVTHTQRYKSKTRV